ncbi:MAG: class I SAM-dependent methyltransferase [Pseudomonadota bacterium]
MAAIEMANTTDTPAEATNQWAAKQWSAGRYDLVARRLEPLAAVLVEAVAHRLGTDGLNLTGQRVVDVACGTGNAALAAAQEGASVTGIDLTPRLLGIARKRAQKAGVAVAWLEGNAESLPLPDGSQDVCLSCLGVMFASDRKAAASDLARVLRPKGILGLLSWQPKQWDDPFSAPMVEALGLPPEGTALPTDWGDPLQVDDLLAPYFDDIEHRMGVHSWTFSSSAEATEMIVEQSPLHVNALADLSQEQREQFVATLTRLLRDCTTPEGIVIKIPYLLLTAQKSDRKDG